MSHPRGRGTLNVHIYVGSGHFLGLKILNFNIFRGFQKNEYFWGYEDLDILGGLYLGDISMHSMVFFKGQGT